MLLPFLKRKALDDKKELSIGPDRDDICTARPYFLVPLLVSDRSVTTAVSDRIKAQVDKMGADVTDIFVFAHGWHRNLFSGIAAYDRLVSRFAVLQARKVIDPQGPFQPLFLAMHWNSDPDPDGWIDTAGRHDRNDFIARMNAQFDVRPGSGKCHSDLVNLYNDIYDLFTYVSAPGTSVLDKVDDGEATELFGRLNECTYIHDAPPPSPSAKPSREDALAKTTVAWRCYDESTPMKMLYRQTIAPRPFNTPWQAIFNLLRFAVAALAAAGLLAGLVPKIGTFLLGLVKGLGQSTWIPLGRIPHAQVVLTSAGGTMKTVFQSTRNLIQHFGIPVPEASWISIYAWLTALSLALLWLATTVSRMGGKRRAESRGQVGDTSSGGGEADDKTTGHGGEPDEKTTGIPVTRAVLWGVSQVCTLVPVLLLLLSTVFFRTWLVLLTPFIWFKSQSIAIVFAALCLVWASIATTFNIKAAGLFAERPRSPRTARDYLAMLARLPFWLLKHSLAPDSVLYGIGDAIDRQLAFFQMQRRGVKAGVEAADFIVDLSVKLDKKAEGARIHLVGHSFGALLVSNLARQMAAKRGLLDPSGHLDTMSPGLQSVCLLQAAQGSDWFAKEAWIRDGSFMRGLLACVHSAYDTATGSIYPLANSSRCAAGSVGLYNPGGRPAIPIGGIPALTSVSHPSQVPLPTDPGPRAVNIDASRFIYDGAVAVGGGHDDVFKDDVVNVIWAVTSADLPSPGAPVAAPSSASSVPAAAVQTSGPVAPPSSKAGAGNP